MRVGCPVCHAEFSLDTLLSCEASREAVAKLAMISLPFGALALRYIALFRPEKRRLSHERAAELLLEMHADVQRRTITRKGRDWDADLESWRAALEAVLAARDKGTLRTPLKDHAYLYEILMQQAEKHEAAAERQGEAARRQHRQAGERAEGAQALGGALPAIVPPVAAGGTARVSPVSHAAKLRAELAARKAAPNSPEPGTPGDD